LDGDVAMNEFNPYRWWEDYSPETERKYQKWWDQFRQQREQLSASRPNVMPGSSFIRPENIQGAAPESLFSTQPSVYDQEKKTYLDWMEKVNRDQQYQQEREAQLRRNTEMLKRQEEEQRRQREYNRMVEQIRQQDRQLELQRGWNPQMGIRRDQYRGAIAAPPSTPPVYKPPRLPGPWLPGMPSQPRTNQPRIGSFAGAW